MDEEADRGAHAHGCEYDDGIDWVLHCMACRLMALTGGEQTMSASRGATPFLNHAPSVAAASVLVGEIDPGLNLSHGVFEETHGPLAMAALVRRRRLQGLHRGSERGQRTLHIALIGQSGRRCERQSGRGGDAGGGYQKKIASAGCGSHCFLFLSDRVRREGFLRRSVLSGRRPILLF